MHLVFCLPGDSCSKHFFDSWNALVYEVWERGWKYTICKKGGSSPYHIRNQLAGGGNIDGKHQIPYQGKLRFDYQVWIDSDQVFAPEHIFNLVEHGKDIVSGVYLTKDRVHTTIHTEFDVDYYKKHNKWRKLTINEIRQKKDLFKAFGMGFGLTVVKQGVFEKLEYPWFYPEYRELPGGGYDFSSEDIGFCSRARAAGLDLWIDPTVIIGHEKSYII